MAKQIIFDCADDEYRVTLYNDDSVEVTHADGFIDRFDFNDEFNMAYGLIESGAIQMTREYYLSLHVSKDYTISEQQQKQLLKEEFIKRIKNAAMNAWSTAEQSSNTVQINIYHAVPNGMSVEEAKRIIRLKSIRKLVPCFINNELLVDINEAMKY